MVRRFILSFVFVIAGFVAGLVVTGRMRTAADSRAASTAPEPAPPASEPQRLPGAVAAAATGGPDFTRVAGQAVKGVANISSLQIERGRRSPYSSDPFFRYFFGDDDVFGAPRDRRSMSLGSGVIISADGYVVTNNHVIGESGGRNIRTTEVTIALPDKREIRGKIVRTDQSTDLALVKVDFVALPFQVARIFHLYLDLQLYLPAKAAVAPPIRRDAVKGGACHGVEVVIGDFGTTQQIQCVCLARQRAPKLAEQCLIDVGRMHHRILEPRDFGVDGMALALKEFPALIVHQPQFPAPFGQAQISIVLAQ